MSLESVIHQKGQIHFHIANFGPIQHLQRDTLHLIDGFGFVFLQHQPARIVDIKFVRPKRGREGKENGTPCRKQQRIEPPTYEEQKAFIEGIQRFEPKAAILTATMSKPSMPDLVKIRKRLPVTVASLYDPKFAQMPLEKLMAECENVFHSKITVTKEEADYLEQSTVLQSESLLWFEHRKGRITASHFGSVFHTSLDSPSSSLISSILQQRPIPDVAALRWGRENESLARQQYMTALSDNHSFFEVEQTGLCINPKYPHLGASPDGMVSCSCCGEGLLEIKFPYSKRDVNPTTVVDSSFYLKTTEDGLKLSHMHNYSRFKARWQYVSDHILTLCVGPRMECRNAY